MKYFISICCWVLFTSCINSIKLHQNYTEPQLPVQEKRMSSFLFGLISGDNIKMWEHCPHGWQLINVHRTGGDILQSVLTVGIYLPIVIRFICHNTSSAPVLIEENSSFDSHITPEDNVKEEGNESLNLDSFPDNEEHISTPEEDLKIKDNLNEEHISTSEEDLEIEDNLLEDNVEEEDLLELDL